MNKNFKANLKSTAGAIVTALGIIFTPFNADATSVSNNEEGFCQLPEIENVVTIGNDGDIIFESIATDAPSATEVSPSTDSETPKAGQYNFNADDAINSAFTDYCTRIGDSALIFKPLADKYAALLHDVRVESVVVTGCPEDEYLNISLYMPGNVLISLNVEEEDPLALVTIYHHKTPMASNMASPDDIHAMLLSVQSRNV